MPEPGDALEHPLTAALRRLAQQIPDGPSCGNCGGRLMSRSGRCVQCFLRCVHPCTHDFARGGCGYRGSDPGPCPKTFIACRDRFGQQEDFNGAKLG
jgi:hypothetical protein